MHLSAGTARENSADMIHKGRWVGYDKRGERNSFSKLTDSIVREIRAEYATGGVTLKALGDRYGVHKTGIHKIVKGETWRHVV